MNKYLKRYILTFVVMLIMNMILHIQTSYNQVTLLTIVWGVLSIYHAIENN